MREDRNPFITRHGGHRTKTVRRISLPLCLRMSDEPLYPTYRSLDIVPYVLIIFLLDISIVKPLDEVRKLQLTGDTTEFDFSLRSFISEGKQTPQRLVGSSMPRARSTAPTVRCSPCYPLRLRASQIAARRRGCPCSSCTTS
jgi:hypothetical protein